MNNQKGMFSTIVGILGLLILIGIGSYYLGVHKATPKEINLENWGTYNNIIVGYSLQYPTEYQPQENFSGYDPSYGPSYESVVFKPNRDSIDKIINSGGYFIAIQHTLLEKDMTILDFWNQQVKEGLIRGQSVVKTTVSGKDAIEVSGTRVDSQDKTVYFIDNKWLTAMQLNFYTPTYAEGKKKFPNAEPYFYQMVKTFTLLPETRGIIFTESPTQDPLKLEKVEVKSVFLTK